MSLEMVTEVVTSSWWQLDYHNMYGYKLAVNLKSGKIYWTTEPESVDITHLAEPRDFHSDETQEWFRAKPKSMRTTYTCTVRWNPRNEG